MTTIRSTFTLIVIILLYFNLNHAFIQLSNKGSSGVHTMKRFIDMKRPSKTFKAVSKTVGIAFTISALANFDSSVLLSSLESNSVNPFIQSAQADSTGKLSTKLTARRRYRPRILEAIPLFQDFANGKVSVEEAQSYLSSEKYQELVRGLRLYGLSLRKGEMLDEISRTVEKITDTFVKDCDAFTSKQKSDLEQLKMIGKDFDDYVKYTEVEK